MSALIAQRLVRSAAAAGCAVRVRAHHSRHWASATFTGTRHALTLAAAASPAFDTWLAGLHDAEFDTRRELVADLALVERAAVGDEVEARIEALTVAVEG